MNFVFVLDVFQLTAVRAFFGFRRWNISLRHHFAEYWNSSYRTYLPIMWVQVGFIGYNMC